MTNSINSIPKGNPLFDLVYNEGWKINNKDSLYGSLATILNSPFNPLSNEFYALDKFGQGTKKAWQTGNIWAFFNSNYYTIPGYKNSDKAWGGGAAKNILETFLGFDKEGNLSIGNTLLDLTYLIPAGGEASLAARLGLTGISKFGLGIAERVLGKRKVQILSSGLGKGWETLKAKILDPILKKIPFLKDITYKKVWDNVVKGAKLASLDPVEWYKTLKNTAVGKLLLGNNQQNLQNLLRNSHLRGKIKPSELPYIVDFMKSTLEGPADLVKFGLDLFTKASPSAIVKLVTSSNFKKKYLPKILDISKSQSYKNFQKALTPYLKGFLEKNVVYNTIKKLYGGYQQIKNSEYIKTAGKLIDKAKKEYKQIKKKGIIKYAKYKLKKLYYYGKRFYHSKTYNTYLKPIVNKAVSVVQGAYNGVKKVWNILTGWIPFRGPAGPLSSSSSFISRASGFTYQGYNGSRKSISQTIGSMSGNCVDGTLAQVALARSFGIPAEMITTTWNGNPHVYGRINGVDRDIANHALTGSWNPPPAGPDSPSNSNESKVELHFHDKIYETKDFEKQVEKVVNRLMPGGAF